MEIQTAIAILETKKLSCCHHIFVMQIKSERDE